MNLSIRDAAQESPEAAALIFETETLSFAEIAARVAARLPELTDQSPGQPVPLRASPCVEALVTLYACFEARLPVGLFHPRWSPATMAQHRERLSRCRLSRSEGPSRPLALLFTSGSTGTPKLVELSVAAFVAAERAHASTVGWRAADRWLLSLPFAHIGGLSVLTRSLIARKPVVVCGDAPFDAASILETVRRAQVTVMSLVPTQLELLLTASPSAPPSVRTVLLGGAAASHSLLERAAAQGWPVLTTYGMTESCAQIIVGTPGTPLPGVDLRIAGDEAAGVGAIEVRSPTLLTAYHEDGGARSPLDADGWFRTGDLGALDAAGKLTVRGRADDVIITGGEKVNPFDVERLLEQVPGIAAACVVGLPDPVWGQIVAAALVVRPELPPGLLETWMKKGLASYERPRRILFVETLPRSSVGKVDRKAIAALLRPPPVA